VKAQEPVLGLLRAGFGFARPRLGILVGVSTTIQQPLSLASRPPSSEPAKVQLRGPTATARGSRSAALFATADVRASKLLRYAKVVARLAELQGRVTERAEVKIIEVDSCPTGSPQTSCRRGRASP